MRLLDAHPEIICKGEGRIFGRALQAPRRQADGRPDLSAELALPGAARRRIPERSGSSARCGPGTATLTSTCAALTRAAIRHFLGAQAGGHEEADRRRQDAVSQRRDHHRDRGHRPGREGDPHHQGRARRRRLGDASPLAPRARSRRRQGHQARGGAACASATAPTPSRGDRLRRGHLHPAAPPGDGGGLAPPGRRGAGAGRGAARRRALHRGPLRARCWSAPVRGVSPASRGFLGADDQRRDRAAVRGRGGVHALDKGPPGGRRTPTRCCARASPGTGSRSSRPRTGGSTTSHAGELLVELGYESRPRLGLAAQSGELLRRLDRLARIGPSARRRSRTRARPWAAP